ncbi:MAG TPA: DUF6111 family protein [Pseudolabrys sp.]|nr:DUF6111 family protein [Pseudolabrys sp.]
MIRPVATELLLFLTPFVLYAVFLWTTKAGVLDVESWPVTRLISLGIAALLLVLGSFVYFAHFTGVPPGSIYIPAHIDNGKFVPGETRKPEPAK